jgi:polysaccharide pyruvyl transferase WcaK-like protein
VYYDALMPAKHKIDLGELYPDLSPEEQERAARNLERYIYVCWKIYQRRSGISDDDSFAQAMNNMAPEVED